MTTTKEKTTIITVAVFLFIALVYLIFQNKSVGWGDSLLFLMATVDGFGWTVNATGHLLYNNFNVLIAKLFPFIDPVRLLTLISILSSLLCLFRLYQIVIVLINNNIAALFSVITLCFSFTFWRQTENIEVYPFYNFIVVNTLYYVMKDVVAKKYDNIYKVGFWMGMAVITHIQTILLLPCYSIYLYLSKRERVKVINSLILFSMVCSLLLITAIVTDTYTISSLFFDFQFKSSVLNLSISTLLKGFMKSIIYVLYNFHVFLLFIVHGIIICYKKEKLITGILGSVILPVWIFASRYPVSDNYVFFLNAYIVLTIVSGYSFRFWKEKIPKQSIAVFLLITSLLLSPVIYYATLRISYALPQFEAFNKRNIYKGGLRYYIWPGMERSIDPLELAIKQYSAGALSEEYNTEEWEIKYPLAIEYLRKTGRIE